MLLTQKEQIVDKIKVCPTPIIVCILPLLTSKQTGQLISLVKSGF